MNGKTGTVLILGATSDMAIAISRTFASHHYNIQLAARKVDELKSLQKDLDIKYNVSSSVHVFDALNFDGHQAFFDSLPAMPDITICVFGYLGDNEVARTDWKETASIINTNYTGAISILNIISNAYALKQKGIVVGISSVAGERGRQSNYIYGSAKAGFSAYLSGLRNRMFKENVHVITVKPGYVYTKMTENLNLPKLLTANPGEVADNIYGAVKNKKNTIYVRWMWRYIMLIIKLIPESIFKKLKL